MSRPGLVSQRQCKVTARRTRASRYRHVCNGSFSPSSPASPYATRTTHVPFHAVCQPLSSFSPGAAPIGAAPAPRRITIFLCSAAASFYAASLLTLRHTVLHSVSRIKSVVPTPKSQMGDIELLMFIIAPIGIHSSATLLFCHRR